MGRYKGSNGLVALGGQQEGSPVIDGAVAQGASTATIDGGGSSLEGVILQGDEFTVAGDGQTYTVTEDVVIGAQTANHADISFTPNVQPAAGWSDDTAVTFLANSLAQVEGWEAEVSRPYLEGTVMGDDARTGTLDQPEWTGSADVLLDDEDDEQSDLIDDIRQNNADVDFGVLFEVAPEKVLYGHVVPESTQITGERGAWVTASFSFQGEGLLQPNWIT